MARRVQEIRCPPGEGTLRGVVQKALPIACGELVLALLEGELAELEDATCAPLISPLNWLSL